MNFIRRYGKLPVIASFLGLCAVTGASAAGPSFSCSGVKASDERAICANGDLSALELRASTDFEYVRDHVDADKSRQIARQALKERRNCGRDVECIRRVLSGAIDAYAQLRNQDAPAAPAAPPVVADDMPDDEPPPRHEVRVSWQDVGGYQHDGYEMLRLGCKPDSVMLETHGSHYAQDGEQSPEGRRHVFLFNITTGEAVAGDKRYPAEISDGHIHLQLGSPVHQADGEYTPARFEITIFRSLAYTASTYYMHFTIIESGDCRDEHF
jgi:uncharacterized protein